jgi:hypothetical protein
MVCDRATVDQAIPFAFASLIRNPTPTESLPSPVIVFRLSDGPRSSEGPFRNIIAQHRVFGLFPLARRVEDIALVQLCSDLFVRIAFDSVDLLGEAVAVGVVGEDFVVLL